MSGYIPANALITRSLHISPLLLEITTNFHHPVTCPPGRQSKRVKLIRFGGGREADMQVAWRNLVCEADRAKLQVTPSASLSLFLPVALDVDGIVTNDSCWSSLPTSAEEGHLISKFKRKA